MCIENILCLGKTMLLCNKLHLEAQKLSNTQVKKSVAYKKSMYFLTAGNYKISPLTVKCQLQAIM